MPWYLTALAILGMITLGIAVFGPWAYCEWNRRRKFKISKDYEVQNAYSKGFVESMKEMMDKKEQ